MIAPVLTYKYRGIYEYIQVSRWVKYKKNSASNLFIYFTWLPWQSTLETEYRQRSGALFCPTTQQNPSLPNRCRCAPTINKNRITYLSYLQDSAILCFYVKKLWSYWLSIFHLQSFICFCLDFIVSKGCHLKRIIT